MTTKLKSFLLVFLFVDVFCGAAAAQAARNAPKILSDAGSGYQFSLPQEFQHVQNDEGFALANAAKTVIIAVKSHNFKSFEEFAAQANLELDGFALAGEITDIGKQGKHFPASKLTEKGTLIVNTFVIFSPFGGGVIIAAFSDKDSSNSAFLTGRKIAESLEFSKPKQTDLAAQWQNFLRGKHLLYFYTSSGFSERIDIYLCPSGKFFWRSDSSSLSQNGSGATGGNNTGTWKVSAAGGASLVLQFQNAATREFKISRRQANNEIGLNGSRYFVQQNNECQ